MRDPTIHLGWSDPEPTAGPAFVWLHVPAANALPIAVLSEAPYTYTAHWIRGLMRPCSRSAMCPLCARRIGLQPRTILAVYDLRERAVGLIELGLTAANQVRRHAEAEGHLRGLRLQLRREAERDRGRIIAERPDASIPPNPDPLPAAPDVVAALTATWARQLTDEERQP